MYKSLIAQLRFAAVLMSLIEQVLRSVLHKDLVLDLEDRLFAEALKAHEMVRDRSGLDRKRAGALTGQARFRMMEQGFEEVCGLHGASQLEGGVVIRSDLKVFQPFMRFEHGGRGVIVGLAAMPEAGKLPPKNRSRLAGVSLNYQLSPRLNFGAADPKIGDVFAMMLVSRDRSRAGHLEELAVGVIDSCYENYLFYEALPHFLRGLAAVSVDTTTVATAPSEAAVVSLKKAVRPFVAPETPVDPSPYVAEKN